MSRALIALSALVCAFFAALSAAPVRAAAVGDVAVISFASDDPDDFAFVVLRDVPAGTALRFTDSGWQGSGSFRANEGGVQLTAPSALTAGTVVRYNVGAGWAVNGSGLGGGGFALATAGDQILTFIGDAATPQFIHALDFGGGYSDATSANTTAQPPGLVVGTSATSLANVDNGYYNGPTSGTPGTLLTAICTASNWVTSNNPVTPPNWVFTVNGGTPVVTGVSLGGSSFNVNDIAPVTVTLNAAPAAGQPVTVQLTSGAFAAPVSLLISNPDSSGVANVTLTNEGIWTVAAAATVGGTGSATSGSFSVGTPHIPPTAYAGADRSLELQTSAIQVNLTGATADDVNGLAGLTYAWTPVSATGLVSWQNRTGAVNATSAPAAAAVTFDAVGAYTLTLTVTDPDGLMASDTVTIFVTTPSTNDEYGPPQGYYAAATGQGETLKTQLAQIITAGHNQQSYGDFKFNSARYDADPAVPGNILLVYNRLSVPAAWDGGATWNREHVWPQSLQPGDASDSTKGNLGDPFVLRPATPSVNGARGNKPYGNYSTTGVYGSQGTFWFPGDPDKGDMARGLFYSATRYMSTLALVDGAPSGNTMGDKASLIRWNYTDPPDTFERRRNHLIYQDQGNRDPFIDHPEWVWSVFGDGTNDSTLYVSAARPADGASSVNIVYPAIIVGGPLPAATQVVLHKAGIDPTYYAVTASGDVVCDVSGAFNAFDFNTQQRTLTVGLATSTVVARLATGTVAIDNLDISSQAPGGGAADANDAIDLALTIYDHANASFAAGADSNALTVDLGTVAADAGVQSASFDIYNLIAASGITADLDIVSVASSGDDDVLTSDAAAFSGIAPGVGVTFHAAFDPSGLIPGDYTATYTIAVADENLPGAATGAPLTLTLVGTVVDSLVPFDSDGDGDVDDVDWSAFADCFTGPGGGLAQPSCAIDDADHDSDIDLEDAAGFMRNFTGSLP